MISTVPPTSSMQDYSVIEQKIEPEISDGTFLLKKQLVLVSKLRADKSNPTAARVDHSVARETRCLELHDSAGDLFITDGLKGHTDLTHTRFFSGSSRCHKLKIGPSWVWTA